jgi:molybdopterin/thiamine biosynthesis adenylyltransferase
MLDAEAARRYARHIVLRGFGGAGQQALDAARIAIIGAGGLGSPALAYLAAAGVGHIRVLDDDTVAISNLQRQIVHRTADIGAPKSESAARFAEALNPTVTIDARAERVAPHSADALLSGCQIVLDGSDDLFTRRAVAAWCAANRVPLVMGALSMFDGQVTVLAPYRTRPDGRPFPSLADLYDSSLADTDLPGCETGGVLGPVAGVIGTLMAVEAVKLIAGIGTPLLGRMLVYDSLAGRMDEIEI